MRRTKGAMHAVDYPAEKLLILVRQALEAGEPPLSAWAWREYTVRDASLLERRRTEPEDELNEVVKLGTMDVEPTGTPEGWTLHVSIVDELGDHLPDDEEAAGEPEEIEVGDFWKEFVRIGPDSTLAEVSAESGAAKQRFDTFLERLLALYG